MHPKKFTPAAAILASSLLVLTARPVSAQNTAAQTAQSVNTTQQLQTPLSTPGSNSQTAPLLYEGELEDLGPQYLLQPKKRYKYWDVSSDFQMYRTSNAALAPADKTATDVSVLSLQLVLHSQEMQWAKGIKATLRAGFSYQSFWYGVFDGREQPIAGSQARFNDFVTYTPFAELALTKGNWSATAGTRYAAYEHQTPTDSGDSTFYQEFVQYWSLGYRWTLPQNQTFVVKYDGDYDGTNTNSFGLQPVGINDHTDQSISFIYSIIMAEHWAIQPSYRLMYDDYTNQQTRNDVYNTFSLVVAYYFNQSCSARALTSYEWRSSTAPLQSYQNWNVGLGGSLSYSF
jgi:hypothetical protein